MNTATTPTLTHPVKGEPVPLSQVREDFLPVPQDDHTQPGRPCGCGLHKRIRLLEGYGAQLLDEVEKGQDYQGDTGDRFAAVVKQRDAAEAETKKLHEELVKLKERQAKAK